MPTVSTLTVRLSANSAKLVAEFGRAQRRARTFGQRMKSSLSVVGAVFTRLAGSAAIGLTALTAAGIKAGDELAKTAQKLGIANEQLSGLRFAAEQTGAGVKTLDLGLQRMVRRVAEAAQGTGEAQKALKELGLDAKELSRQAPDEQFRRIADAFEAVGTQSDKVRLGFKLFDSEGVALVNTLQAGRKELDRFTAEAKAFGLTLTGRQLANLQKAADSQNRVAKAFSGLGRQLGATFSPAMSAAADATADLVARLTSSIPKLTAVAAGIFGINREVSNLTASEIRAEMQNIIRLTGEAIDERDKAERKLQSGTSVGLVPGRQAQIAFEQYQMQVDKLSERYTELKEALAKVDIEQEKVTSSSGTFNLVSQEQRNRVKALADQWKKTVDGLNEYINAQDRIRATGQSIFTQTRNDLEIYLQRLSEAKEALESGFLPGGQNTFDRYQKQLQDRLLPTLDKVKEKGQELKLEFASAFEDAVVEGEKFRKVLEGIYKDLLRILLRKNITEPFGDAFAGIVGSLFNAPAAGISTSTANAAAGAAAGFAGTNLFVPPTSLPTSSKSSNGKAAAPTIINQYSIQAGADWETWQKIMPGILDENRRATISELSQMKAEGAF